MKKNLLEIKYKIIKNYWDRSKFGESFQIEDINLEDPEESPTFHDWEF